jgi:hypothetical protein
MIRFRIAAPGDASHEARARQARGPRRVGRFLVAMASVIGFVGLVPGVIPAARATAPDFGTWGDEAGRVIVDARQHLGQAYSMQSYGGWGLSGGNFINTGPGNQTLSIGEDCKDFVSIVMIETGHVDQVGSMRHGYVVDMYNWMAANLRSSLVDVPNSPSVTTADVSGIQPGDIVFFGNPDGGTAYPNPRQFQHAAIYTGKDPVTGANNSMIGETVPPAGVQENPISWMVNDTPKPNTKAYTLTAYLHTHLYGNPAHSDTIPWNTTDLIFDKTGEFYQGMDGNKYWPLPSTRVLDTRPASRIGTTTTLVSKGVSTFKVAGVGAVPAAAVAVTGNLTVVGQSAAGYVTLARSGLVSGTSPSTSTINFPVGDIRANGVTIGLDSTGSLSAQYSAVSGATVDIIFDVTGWFGKNSNVGYTFHTLAPARVLDTRLGLGTSRLTSKTAATFQVSGAGRVPANAVAVTGNLTVTGQSAPGYLTVAPSGIQSGAIPSTSTLNFPLSDTRANGVTVGLDINGKLSIMYSAVTGAMTDAIFDVTGYFTFDTSGATYYPLDLVRVLDSRSGASHVGNATTFTSQRVKKFHVSGMVPYGLVAVTGNLTVANQTGAGYVTLAPSGLVTGVLPPTSTLNFPVGDYRSNTVTVGIDSNGDLSAVLIR